eukprot:519981_1
MQQVSIRSKYDAYLYKKRMQQHKNAIKQVGARIDCKPPTYHKQDHVKQKTNGKCAKKKLTRPKSSRHMSSHSIVQNRKNKEIERKNRAIVENIMTTKFSIDNKEPHRFKKPLHHIVRKNQQAKIQNQNHKIHKVLCKTRSKIPSSNELQARWKQQRVLKHRMRKPSQLELVHSKRNKKSMSHSRSMSTLSLSAKNHKSHTTTLALDLNSFMTELNKLDSTSSDEYDEW